MIPDSLAGDALFKSIFDAAAVGVALVDGDGRFVAWNAAFLHMLGRTDDDLRGKRFVDFTHTDDAHVHTRLMAELLGGVRESFVISKRYVRPDGGVVRAEVTASLASGYVIGVVKDITAEWEAREERDRLLARVEKRIKELTALQRAAQLLEQSMLPLSTLLEQLTRLLPPAFEHPEHTVARIAYGSFHAETPGYRAPRLQLATGFATSDGTSGTIEVGYARDQPLEAKEPFLDEERALIRTLAEMLRVRLERTVAERRLHHSQETLGVVLDSVDVGYWEWDVLADRMVWSEEMSRLSGLATTPSIHRFGDRFHLVHPDDLDGLKAVVHEGLADRTRHVLEHEFRIIRPDGEERWLLGKAHVFRTDTGVALRLLGVVIDVTSRHRLQEQFMQAQKLEAIGRFASSIAHDFNNALAVIVGECDVLRETNPTAAALRHGIRDISEAAERASHLTQQLVTFSRTGRTDPQVLDPGDVVARLEKFLRAVAGSHELHLEFGSSEHIRIDRRQLEQAIVNLVVNARDAMPSRGAITVGTGTTPDGQVTISVRDNGTGMDEATVSRVFEPFFTTKEIGKGTGLGLAVVQTVVQAAGGDIHVDTAPGRGTTFELRFPAAT